MVPKTVIVLALASFMSYQAKADIFESVTLGQGTIFSGSQSFGFTLLSDGSLTIDAQFGGISNSCLAIDPTMPYQCTGQVSESVVISSESDGFGVGSVSKAFYFGDPFGLNDDNGYQVADSCENAANNSEDATCTTYSLPSGNYVLTLSMNDFESSNSPYFDNQTVSPSFDSMSASIGGDVTPTPEPNLAALCVLLFAVMFGARAWAKNRRQRVKT